MLCGIAFLPFLVAGQDLDARSPKQNDPITKQQRSAEKKKLKRIEKQAKADEAARKRAIKIQTKEVRKRMKKSKKKANKWNSQ